MILGEEVKDPRVNTFLSITGVQVSKDLAYAKVFVSSFESEAVLDEAVLALNHAAGFIQGRIGRRLRLRVTPKLRFHADLSIRDGFEITRKIEGLSS